MKRVCLIGDSHISALKTAWDQIGGEFRVRATFFAAPGPVMKDLVIVDGFLEPGSKLAYKCFRRTAGKHRINPDKYDVFLLAGGGMKLLRILNLYLNFGAESGSANDSRRKISDDCFHDAAVNLLRQSPIMDMREKLGRISDKPVIIMQEPTHAEGVLEHGPADKGQPYKRLLDLREERRATEAFERAKQALRSSGTMIVDQPEETFANSILSRNEFARGVAQMEGLSPVQHFDHTHMNTAYGTVVLRKLADQGLL